MNLLLPCPPTPPCLPDLIQCDYFLWGYIKDHEFVLPSSTDLTELERKKSYVHSLVLNVICWKEHGKNLSLELKYVESPDVC